MHGSGPKLIIVAKREMLADEMPNFDGDSYVEAKKKMMSERPEVDDLYSDEPHAVMKQIAEELHKASKVHAGQADKLIEICEKLYQKEKRSHKAAGDNSHGEAKEMY
jgi:hypothetical protein